MNAKELVEYIAKALVDHPDQVRVSEIEGERTSVIELSVAKEDLGKVIGKQGRTARSIRVILANPMNISDKIVMTFGLDNNQLVSLSGTLGTNVRLQKR